MRERGAVRASGAVYEELRQRLISGDFEQGERISVESLRTHFEVSKQPIMEALRRLAADGLVEIVPQVGSIVVSFPVRDAEDFFDMFAGVEGAIAAAAARRRTEAQLRDLSAIAQRIDALVDDPTQDRRTLEYTVLNRQFHLAVHEMAASRIMADASRRLWDLSDFLINTSKETAALDASLAERHADHERIRGALERGDHREARTQMEWHIRETARLVGADGTRSA